MKEIGISNKVHFMHVHATGMHIFFDLHETPPEPEPRGSI